MFKVGDLVAVKRCYEMNEWRDVFKVLNFTSNETFNIQHVFTDKGKTKTSNKIYYNELVKEFILIPELNKREIKSHLPKWW